MEFVYIPKACKDREVDVEDEEGESRKEARAASFTGSVILKSLDFDEACDLSEKITLALVGVPEAIKNIRRAREMVKITAPYVVAVDLKRLSDGQEFKSWDELRSATGNTEVLADVASVVMSGPEAGNG